jgi:glyoxylase-like metal-dependent hydrolase (beta-lactamase superfamily II)
LEARIDGLSENLSLITLTPPLKGFTNFISAWLYQGETSFLVDVGPSTTGQKLLALLQEREIAHLDYILLTHIHLDHAGAIGEIAAEFPKTPIVCHETAIPHLIDPARLWEGTRKVLGSMADAYGPVQPVAADRLVDAAQLESEFIFPIITPGHAVHHVSYDTEKYLFAGETAGVCYTLGQDSIYMRPATPPKFFLETAVDSLDSLIDRNPTNICYGHYGIRENAATMLQTHRDQILFWANTIRKVIASCGSQDPIDACAPRLLAVDPLMAGFYGLPPDVQERENYFLKNSLRGFIGYLKNED